MDSFAFGSFVYSALSSSKNIFLLDVCKNITKKQNKKQSQSLQQTVSQRFKRQLSDLMNRMNTTTPRFIRCIKSNEKRLPMEFDSPLVLR